MHYKDFHEAFKGTLYDTYNNPQFFNAPRGNQSRERLNYHFTIENPVERVCYFPSRKTNVIFNFAEVLWYLSADNKLDFINYYANNMSKYSSDGKTLTGTAYGPKIFEFGNAKINQWKKIKDLLLFEDPDSKRAFMQIFDATELIIPNNIDVSCTLGFQFFVRENKLHMLSYMRANDAFRGIISDVFSFTFIQELMAKELGLKVGEYHHNIGSIHIYQTDDEWAEKVLQEAKTTPRPDFVFPEMPSTDNWISIEKVLKYEYLLRNDEIRMSAEDIEQLNLSEYWKQLLLLFSLYQYIAYERPPDLYLYDRLLPVYQYFVANKWPSVFKNKVSPEVWERGI